MRNQEIPEPVILRAESRLKSMGFKHRVSRQATQMIAEVTEITEALGGRIDWSEPRTETPASG